MDSFSYLKINSTNKEELQREFDFFLEQAERKNWDVSDDVIKYMNELQGLIRALS